jgi:ATP-dependent Lhr-like helicase
MAADALSPLEHLDLPCSAAASVAALPEPVRLWLERHVGEPTPAQRLAWPALAEGKNLLLCAPTGSGKTLAAFLPPLARLMTGPPIPGVRCLYLSPLKALGNDVRKNLRTYIAGIRGFLPDGFGNVRVGLRTGDTSARVRREQRLDPPEILLTTPESLAVLLSHEWAPDLFANLGWVIIDEVHALAVNKRGCDLSLSLERLTHLVGGELQRVGLSATCAPAAEAARFLVGVGRPCAIAQVPATARLELTVELLAEETSFLTTLVARLERELRGNRSTLIFANARGLSERLSWALRRRFPEWAEQIAVHHSSLAPKRRRLVERGLKRGELRAVVSSTSLELGIDIGTVDGVILVHPPGDVVRLLQRVGRSGHGPGLLKRGLVLAANPGELLEAAVTAASTRSAQYEPLRVPAHPLDVLCQQLLGMAVGRSWTADEAFALVRRAHPYRELPRDDFDACLDYLSGRQSSPLSLRGRGAGGEGDGLHCACEFYTHTQPPTPDPSPPRGEEREWLPARLSWDGDEFRTRDERTAKLLRRNVGTILAETARPVVVAEEGTSGKWVGEVEEPFAERLNPGDRFLLDGRCLEYRRDDGQALLVQEVLGRPAVPRWGSDGCPLSAELARRLYLLRVQAAEALRGGRAALAAVLRADCGLDDDAAAALAAHFERQECVSEVPDAATLLIEVVSRQGAADHYLHTPLNRAGNDALARLAVLRLARDRGRPAHSLVTDLGLMLSVAGGEVGPDDWRGLLSADAWEADLSLALRESPALAARFQRVALTGLMLLRNPLGRKQRVGGRDWGERRLFDKVRRADPDFVLLRQAERELRCDLCDGETARGLALALPQWAVRCRRLARISPFVEAWGPVQAGPAEVVETPAEALQRLHATLMGGT